MSVSVSRVSNSSSDPTQSTTLRRSLKRDLRSRERTVQGHMTAVLKRNDALRIKERDPGDDRTQDELGFSIADLLGSDVTKQLRPRDFRAVEDAARVEMLEDWIGYVLYEELVGRMGREEVRSGDHWTADYLRKAYVKGDRLAVRDLKSHGFDVDRERPGDILQTNARHSVLRDGFSDIYHDLTVISDDAKHAARRTARSALASGAVGVTVLADDVKEQVDAEIGDRLSQMADVRIVETVNLGAIDRYALTDGVDGLSPVIERPENASEERDTGRWTAAGDNRVCSECLSLEGSSWPIERIKNGATPRPPIHVGCRCLLELSVS